MTSEQYVKAYLAQDSYLVVNKAFVQKIGLIETTLLSLLLDRHTYFSQQNQTDNGWFYCTGESLQNTLNLGRRPLDAALKNLETAHFVEVQRKGLPAKKYFRLSFDNIKTAMGLLNQVCPKCSNLYNQNAQTYNNNKDNNNKDIIDNSSLRSELSESLLSTTTTEKNNNSLLPPIIPQAETETQQPQTEKAEIITASELEFDEFRKIYRGTKRGLRTEFTNFCKKHKDWKAVLPTLKERYEHQCELKDQARMFGCFVPVEKNLQTYLNQRCWEEEPQFQRQPKRDSEKTTAEKMAEIELGYQQMKQQEQQLKQNKYGL